MAKPCTVDNCNNPRFSGGLCVYHKKASNPSKYQIHIKTPVKGDNVSKPRIPKQSAKLKARLVEYKLVRDQYMIAHPVCEANIEGVCTYEATDNHHRKGKIGELLCDVRYFLAVCRSCHNFIENSPTLAKKMGLSLDRLSL